MITQRIQKKPHAALTTVFVILLLGATAGLRPAAAAPRHVEGELLVKFAGGPRGAGAEHTRRQMRHEVKHNFDRIGWQHIRLPAGMTVEEGMARYSKLPNVLAVEPNGLVSAIEPVLNPPPDSEDGATSPIPNDPRFSAQWNLRLLEMTNAWAVTPGSAEVVVAVLDSGIDYTHEDLRDNMWRNPGETGTDNQGRDKRSNGIDDDGNGYIDDVYGIDVADDDSDPMDLGAGEPRETGHFHGTACAGIIGAVGNNAIGMAGVNWTVRLMAIRVGTTNNVIPYANSLQGVEYLIAMKERGVNIRASNHSYGGGGLGFSQAHYDAGLAHQAAGIVWVNAAGNSAVDSDKLTRSPQGYGSPFLINVAATDIGDALATYSNYGRSLVDLAAPGNNPLTTQPANRYFTDYSGTSFSAPHVAGAVGLLAGARPDSTPLQIRAALMHSVDQKPGLTNKMVTHGRLNVGRAIQVLTNEAMPPIVVAVTPRTSQTRPEQHLDVWFSRPMDRVSVEAAFEVNPPLAGTFSWAEDSTHFQFLRAEPFVWTNHTARIRAAAMSVAGLTLDGNYNRIAEGTGADDYVWTFTFPPRNDDFENAEPIANQNGAASNTTYNASWQFEPSIPSLTKTNWRIPGGVWYRWTPDHDGWITFETASTSLDTLLAAYTGNDLTMLTEVANNDDDGLRSLSRMSFAATGGTSYPVIVRTQHPTDQFQAMGPFTLRWYPTPPPFITSLTPATTYPGQRITLNGTNFTGATSVLFNGVPATFTFSTNAAFTDLQLTATVPDPVTTGPITIETPHGNFTTASNFTVLAPLRMTIRPLPGTNQLELSWPSTLGITLQRTDNLGPTAWVGAAVVSSRLSEGIRYVTVTNSVRNRFFRLYRP